MNTMKTVDAQVMSAASKPDVVKVNRKMSKRTCACGHTRNHPEVQQEPEYTLWGWIMLSMLGMTPSPERVVFRCIRCKQSLGVSRDPALLHKKQMPTRDENAS